MFFDKMQTSECNKEIILSRKLWDKDRQRQTNTDKDRQTKTDRQRQTDRQTRNLLMANRPDI